MNSENKNQNGIKKLFKQWIDDDREYLVFIKMENKIFHIIRETYPENWELVELCREAIFENDKLSRLLVGRIKDVEKRAKELI